MESCRKYIHYENTPIQIYRKFPLQKLKNIQIKYSDIFHISAQNIDCVYSLEPPRRGGSNEYPQSMYLSRNKKNNVYPCKPQFYYIKVGFKGSKLYRHVFVMKTYVVGTHMKRLKKALLMSIHSVCFLWRTRDNYPRITRDVRNELLISIWRLQISS